MGSLDVTLYARWLANPTYTLTYDANGGGGNVPATASYEDRDIVTVASGNNLAKVGYVFDGWNTVPSGGGTNYTVASTFTMSSTSVTLYAQWKADICSGEDHAEIEACWSTLGPAMAWSNAYPQIRTGVSISTNLGDAETDMNGKSNQDTIISTHWDGKLWYASESNYPAFAYCEELEEGENNDWYLPSIGQLKTGLENWYQLGFVDDAGYWSSTEGSASYAWGADYSSYDDYVRMYHNDKLDYNNVRCLR